MSFKSVLAAGAVLSVIAPVAAFAMPTQTLGGIDVPVGGGAADGEAYVSYGTNGSSFDPSAPSFSGVNIFGQVREIGFDTGAGQILGAPTAELGAPEPFELTYVIQITGFTPDLANSTPSNFLFSLDSANIAYYLDDTPDFNGASPSVVNALGDAPGDTPWLTAELAAPVDFQITLANGFVSTLNNQQLLFDVIDPADINAGLFNAEFDTDTLPGGADFRTISFQTNGTFLPPNPLEFDNTGGLLSGVVTGSTDTQFFTREIEISEPGTIGLLGLGLAGMGLALRRRKA